MRLFFLSDIHTDFWWPYANSRKEYEMPDPPEEVTRRTLEHRWSNKRHIDLFTTDVDGIIVPGDLGNDWLTSTRTLKWLREKYKKVYFVPGNHDIAVRGGTPSKSNVQFKNSIKKIEAYRTFCKENDIVLLEGDVVDGIGGCMMMCDFSWGHPLLRSRSVLNWKRHWYDGKTWRYMDNDPDVIFDYYSKMLDEIVAKKPKVIVTHFCPSILPITFDWRNAPENDYFYFDASKWLNEIEQDTIWICGHTHDPKRATYLNKKGALITVMCNPQGYPSDRHYNIICNEMIEGEKEVKRTFLPIETDRFIIDV